MSATDQFDLFAKPKPKQARFKMREPCRKCASWDGTLSRSGLHIKVDCYECRAYVYMAPKGEAEDAMREIERSHGQPSR